MNGEAGLLNLRQRQLVLDSLAIQHLHLRIIVALIRRHDLDFNMAANRRKSCALQRGTTPNESLPVLQRSQRALEPRRRHFQHVPTIYQTGTRVELRLNCTRRQFTVPDLHLFAIPSIDPDIKDRSSLTAANAEIDEVETDHVKFLLDNSLQTTIHVDSAFLTETKKCGATSPTSRPRSRYRRTLQ